MNRVFLMFFLIAGSFSFAQKIKVEAVNPDFIKFRNSERLDYLHDSLDKNKCTWVVDLTVTFDSVFPGQLYESFKAFKIKANKMGANSFLVKGSDIYANQSEKFISISAYFLKQENRTENYNYFLQPNVYLFGFLGYHQLIAGYNVQIQEEEFMLNELRYKSFSFKVGETIHLEQGSKIRGDSKTFEFEEKPIPRYFYFNKISGSFRNCFINEYEMNFGEYLLRILDNES